MDRGKYSNVSKKSDGKISARTAAFMEDVLPGYEEYLLLLQEKNRLVKKLRKKDKKQVELERKEQGFSLYVNGANAELKPDVSPDSDTSKSKNKLPKTAGELRRPNGPLTHRDLEYLAREERERMREKHRAKTAPSKTRRKNWNVESIEVTTDRGLHRKIHAPEILTGRYEEDFESDDDDDDDDSDIEIDASSHTRPLSPKKHSYIKKKADEYRQDLEDNRMTLRFSDVKKLRQSLEMNQSIRQSLALEISSMNTSKEGQEDSILEEIQDESGDELAPTIQEESEEEEEVEEDIIQSIDKSNQNNSSHNKKPNPFKPGELIVLEFAPSVKKREERSLSTVKRKSSESLLSARKSSDTLISPRSQQQVILNETKELQSVSTSKNKKQLKPLAARKSSSNTSLNSQEETKAVLAALQAENAQVEKYSKESKSKSKTSPKKVKSRTPCPSALTPSTNSLTSPPQKPSASSSDGSLSDDKITEIVDKVLYMTPKQQCRLVKLFRKIDDDNLKSPEESIINKREPLKALSPISSMVHNKQSSQNEVEVNIEISSNWGHPSRLGLTEIQFYDQDKQLIPVDTSSVRIHGVQQAHAPIDVLFNGKTKTTKERYMWVCDFSGKRIEFVINLKNPEPDKLFQLAVIKVWNWNKSINGLDMGARHCRVFVGGELVFDGDLEKGCGNHIYDYSTSINIKNNSNTDNGGNKTPSSSHHTFRSISRSSLSSASSSSSSRPVSATTQPLPLTPSSPVRSRTRTVVNSDTSLNRPVIESDDDSSPDSDNIAKDSKSLPDQPICHTPRKSKRLVARLDGHSSETESSKSLTDSNDKKPPLPSTNRSNASLTGSTDIRQSKSNQKPPRSSQQPPSPSPRSLQPPSPRLSQQQPSPRLSQQQPPPRLSQQQPSPRLSQSKPPSSSINQDDFEPQDVSMLQKVKDLKISLESESSSSEENNVPFIAWHLTQSQKDEPRRKDIPKWLSKDDFTADRFEGPPESRGNSRNQVRSEAGKERLPNKSKDDGHVDDLINELDDVLSPFSTNSANDKRSSKSSQKDRDELEDDFDETPMDRIQKNRSKWREAKNSNLEESWGSLSFFNRSQRGRLSVDMADDALDEYLPSSRKQVPKEETIEEEFIINDNNEDNFTIPELPYGRQITIDIKTTWGDHHYVGLTGVEVFSSTGEQVQITKVTAEPLDINILPEYSKDPRVVSNIIDGCNRTRDDVHMWLTPFTAGSHHYVYLTLCKPCQIAMIRVWNYNKSRIHSYRGAREVTITLDKNIIFIGEIARACGGIEGGTESFGDTILFTTDEDILEEVSKNDEAYEGEILCEAEDEHVPYDRPSTADESEDRPLTRAVGVMPVKDCPPRPETSYVTTVNNVTAYKTKNLELNFTDTWGDPHYLGLTALEVVGKDGEAIPIRLSMLKANPKDVTVLPGHDEDARTLDKLIDGTTLTISDEHMWLVPFIENKNHLLTITFPDKVLVTGLRIWNYNKSREDTYRGAKIVNVKIDGRQISPPTGYLIRKGPGSCHFDFAQEINFTCNNNNNNDKGFAPVNHTGGVETSHDYEAVQMPCGFIYQFQLFTTWSDQYYMGLNGLELYDENLKQIHLTDNNISAHPACVNVLDNMENDVRTPDKLINGVNDTNDGKNTWLAPILPGLLNRVYVIFDQPTTVSMIKIWNYSKTPTRGVKDFALLVDDLLVYNGTLESVTPGVRGIIPTCTIPQKYHTVLFTQNPDLVRKEKHTIINNQAGEQDVQLLNDKKIITKYADPKKAASGKPVNQELRPKTSVTGQMKSRR